MPLSDGPLAGGGGITSIVGTTNEITVSTSFGVATVGIANPVTLKNTNLQGKLVVDPTLGEIIGNNKINPGAE